MGAFGTAFTLATNINVLPMAIYTEFTLQANVAMAAALSFVLGAITWIALARRRRHRWRRHDRRGGGLPRSVLRNRPAFWLQLAFTLLGLRVPDRAGVHVDAGRRHAELLQRLASGLTLALGDQGLDRLSRTRSSARSRSRLPASACTLVLGVPPAYVLARKRNALARAIEELLVMPVAVPGLATALALIVTFGGFGELRTSWVFILIGHVLFTLPFMVRSVLAVLASIDLKTLEEGARVARRQLQQRFFGIVLPNCRAGIVAGSLMVVTLSLGEFNMTCCCTRR